MVVHCKGRVNERSHMGKAHEMFNSFQSSATKWDFCDLLLGIVKCSVLSYYSPYRAEKAAPWWSDLIVGKWDVGEKLVKSGCVHWSTLTACIFCSANKLLKLRRKDFYLLCFISELWSKLFYSPLVHWMTRCVWCAHTDPEWSEKISCCASDQLWWFACLLWTDGLSVVVREIFTYWFCFHLL